MPLLALNGGKLMSRPCASETVGERRSAIPMILLVGVGLLALALFVGAVHHWLVVKPNVEKHEREMERLRERTRQMREQEEEKTRKILKDIDALPD